MIKKGTYRLAKLVPGQLTWIDQIASNFVQFERNQGFFSKITIPRGAPNLVATAGDIVAYNQNGYPQLAGANGVVEIRRPIGFIVTTNTYVPGMEVIIGSFGRTLAQHSIISWPQAGEIAWLSDTLGEISDSPGTNPVPIGHILAFGNILYSPTILL